MSRTDMSISAFSRRSLLSIKALRHYDESGLLRPDRVDPQSGYRYYGEHQLVTARLISALRRLDVPLAEISQIVVMPVADAARALAQWWEQEEEAFAQRRDLLQYIRRTMLNDGRTANAPYDITVATQPETTYLWQRQHLNGPELPAFIRSATWSLRQRATELGGVAQGVTVVILGVADLDSDGPVEVRLAVSGLGAGEGVQVESAHMQARISVTRPQLAFPQILQVYHALREWIPANGYEVAGPPREIYVDDIATSGLLDPVCDIAIPVIERSGDSHERT